MKIKPEIEHLIKILNDDAYLRMNKSNIKGFLGELYIKQKLEDEGFTIEHLGNQSGSDLKIVEHNLFIDAKLSTVTDPDKWYANWGWALQQSSKKKISCTHFVCVAIDENHLPIAYYIMNAEDVDKFPAAKGRFKNVTRSFVIQKHSEPLVDNPEFNLCRELLLNNTVRKISSNQSLIEHLIQN